MERRSRLRHDTDFRRVRRTGKAWNHRLVVMVASPNRLEHSRYGFVVSKRLGKAVQRNLIKRRMRESVRLRQELITPGWDLVFIARQPIAGATYHDIEEAIIKVLKRSRLLRSLATAQR